MGIPHPDLSLRLFHVDRESVSDRTVKNQDAAGSGIIHTEGSTGL